MDETALGKLWVEDRPGCPVCVRGQRGCVSGGAVRGCGHVSCVSGGPAPQTPRPWFLKLCKQNMKIKIKSKPTTTVIGEWVPGEENGGGRRPTSGSAHPLHPRRRRPGGWGPRSPWGKAFPSFSPVPVLPVYLRAWSTCVHMDTAGCSRQGLGTG